MEIVADVSDHKTEAMSTISRSRHRGICVFGVKLAIGICLLGYLVYTGRFDPHVYENVLSGHHGWAILGVLVGQVAMMVLPMIRWWILLKALDIPLSLGESLRVSLMGCFANLFIPGGLGIDGVRLLYLRKHYHSEFSKGVWSILLDRVLGVVALAFVGGGSAILLIWMTTAENVDRFVTHTVLPVAGALVALGLFAIWMSVAHNSALSRFTPLARLFSASQAIRGRYSVVVLGFVISVLGHLSVGAAAYCGLIALGFQPSAIGVLAVTPIVTLSKTVPLTPLGLGVTDGVASVLYPLVGLGGGGEVQMLLRVTMVGIALACGLAYFKRYERVATADETSVEHSPTALTEASL